MIFKSSSYIECTGCRRKKEKSEFETDTLCKVCYAKKLNREKLEVKPSKKSKRNK